MSQRAQRAEHAAEPSAPQPAPPQRSAGLTPVFRNALSSTMGAAVVGTVVTPFDVVKVRVQAHVCPVGGSGACHDPLHVEGPLDALRKIVRQHGVRGLWRGLNATLLLAIPTTGMYFTLYEAFREHIEQRWAQLPNTMTALVAGASARTATATVASPLELARTSLQAGVGGANGTVLSVLRQVRRQSGMRAWWRGLGPTLLRDAPFSAIYWSAYEALKDPSRSILPQRLMSANNEFGVYLGAGIGAGALAALCTVPADVLKTRRQAVMAAETAAVRGVAARGTCMASVGMARHILETEGVRGMFRGAAPRVAKVAPACAIMMGTYELFRTMLGLERKS